MRLVASVRSRCGASFIGTSRMELQFRDRKRPRGHAGEAVPARCARSALHCDLHCSALQHARRRLRFDANGAAQPANGGRHARCSRAGNESHTEVFPMDALYVGLTVIFFAVSLALVELLDRL
jgi:hypothetical protein